MKTVTTLDANDIEEIIAKHFNVDMDQVKVYIEGHMTGYGPTESIKHEAYAKVIRERD